MKEKCFSMGMKGLFFFNLHYKLYILLLFGGLSPKESIICIFQSDIGPVG